MTTTTLTKTAREIVAAGTSNAAAGSTRGTLDLRTAMGGLLTMKMTNGGSAPSVQCECRVYVAHNNGATPSPGGSGADWKMLWSFGNGVVAGTVTQQSMEIGPGVMHLQVEFIGNLTQAVTVEAYLSEVTDAQTA